MSVFPVRYKLDSVNGGTYDFRQKSASLWRDSLENANAFEFAQGSRYFHDFMSIADAPAAGTLTGEVALRDLDGNATSEAGVKTVPAGTTRPLHGWLRVSCTSGADARGVQAALPDKGDVRFTTGKRTVFEISVNIRKTASWFIGLGETEVAIMTASETMADKDFIGFRRNDAGVVQFVTHKTGTTEQAVTILTAAQLDALAAGGTSLSITSGAEIDLPINLGLAVAFNGANSLLDISVNGVMYPTAAGTLMTANASAACLPTKSMTRMVIPCRATTDATGNEATVAIEADWVETFQQV